MIRVFHYHSMAGSAFDLNQPNGLDYLQERGVAVAPRLEEADVLLSPNGFGRRIRLQLRLKRRRPHLLVYTHEPRYNTCFQRRVRGWGLLADVHVMNAYTGDIYLNNYNIYGKFAMDRPVAPVTEASCPALRSRTIALMAICRSNRQEWTLVRDGRELDLCYLRTTIGLEGHRLGKVDVYGQGWPEGVVVRDSRWNADWHEDKVVTLQRYHFNLCFENTNIPYYVSEKIWDSIKAHCLPVYYGEGNGIYNDFPPDSFIDYARLGSPAALFDFVERMDVGEFRRRLNLCIDVYNRIRDRHDWRQQYDKMLDNIVLRLQEITGKCR